MASHVRVSLVSAQALSILHAVGRITSKSINAIIEYTCIDNHGALSFSFEEYQTTCDMRDVTANCVGHRSFCGTIKIRRRRRIIFGSFSPDTETVSQQIGEIYAIYCDFRANQWSSLTLVDGDFLCT